MAILERWRNLYLKVSFRQRMLVWHKVVGFYVYLLLVWGVYRLLSPLPVWVEETIVKGVVFGLPVWWLVRVQEKRDWSAVGVGATKLFEAVYLGLALGVLFWFFGQAAHWLRYEGVLSLSQIQPTSGEFGAFLLLALVTAFWEELVFMGYILPRLATVIDEWRAALITTGMFGLLYAPAMMVRQVSWPQMVVQLLLILMLGLGNAILMLRTRNLAAPILAHALWGVTLYLLG